MGMRICILNLKWFPLRHFQYVGVFPSHKTYRNLPVILSYGITQPFLHGSSKSHANEPLRSYSYRISIAEGLEKPIQLIYVGLLLSLVALFLGVIGSQLLLRRELDERAKILAEKINSSSASPSEYYELGAVLIRKKLYSQALRNLQKSIRLWDGEEIELAQVYNAVGFARMELGQFDEALYSFSEAVRIQPGYVVAWNNLGTLHERDKKFRDALTCYEETLTFEQNNKVAMRRKKICIEKI